MCSILHVYVSTWQNVYVSTSNTIWSEIERRSTGDFLSLPSYWDFRERHRAPDEQFTADFTHTNTQTVPTIAYSDAHWVELRARGTFQQMLNTIINYKSTRKAGKEVRIQLLKKFEWIKSKGFFRD